MDTILKYKYQAIIELKKLGKSQSSEDDLNFLFSSVSGLVRANLEIQQRIGAHRKDVSTNGTNLQRIHANLQRIHAHRKQVSTNETNPKQFVTCTRHIFSEVKVTTPQHAQGYGDKRMTFTVTPEAQTRTFRQQPAFPKLLRSFVPFDEDGGLAKEWCNSRLEEDKYTRFLTSAALLSTDVLIPILDVFKSHLEDLQVYFGEIEGWILEQSANKRYLEATFNINLNPSVLRGGPLIGSVGNNYVCQRCYEQLSLHSSLSGCCRAENLRQQQNDGYSNGCLFGDDSDDDGHIYNNGTNLLNNGYNNGRNNNGTNLIPPEPPPKYSKEGEFWYVEPMQERNLTEVVSKDSYEATFDVSTDSGCMKLNGFLAYVNVCT
jgi:hypothetical protein